MRSADRLFGLYLRLLRHDGQSSGMSRRRKSVGVRQRRSGLTNVRGPERAMPSHQLRGHLRSGADVRAADLPRLLRPPFERVHVRVRFVGLRSGGQDVPAMSWQRELRRAHGYVRELAMRTGQLRGLLQHEHESTDLRQWNRWLGLRARRAELPKLLPAGAGMPTLIVGRRAVHAQRQLFWQQLLRLLRFFGQL